LTDEQAALVRSVSSIVSQEEPLQHEQEITAAVAVIIADSPDGPQALLILRPEGGTDPWSGQVALPGGRVKGGDENFEATAIREAQEEVGVKLAHSGFLGYLGKYQPRIRSIWVVAAVFVLDAIPAVTPNREVASYKWVPFRLAMAPGSRTRHVLTRDGVPIVFPAFKFGDYVVWGLTEKILTAITDAARKGAPS
jgi:8-oxo-dGTP pyrophosphatase MutT (NUDIX family)